MSKLYKSLAVVLMVFLASVCLSAQTQTLRLKPLTTSDDAEQNTTTGTVQLNSSDLELGGFDFDGNYKQVVGIRFPNVMLPQGATISRAYIQFSVDATATTGASITIRAQRGNAATYAATANNISSRTYTTANVAWTTPAWTVLNQRLAAQQTPDLKELLTEAMQTDFVSGNALAFHFSTTVNARTEAYALDRGAANAPELVIEYSGVSENIDVFILAGQSNAQGWAGNAAQYPTNTIDNQIRLYYTLYNNTSSDGQWINMQPQKGMFPAGHFGPEVTFSRKLKEAGYNPAIFKFTLGATSLYGNWKQPGQGGMYDAMAIEYKKAIKKLTDAGHTVTVRGFVWIQGEYDAVPAENLLYQGRLTNLIKDLRLNVVKDTCLPVVLGVDEQFPSSLMGSIVQAQKNIDISDDKVVFTSMIGLQKADATHLTPSGLIVHGQRVYDGYTTIIPNIGSFSACSNLNISADKASGNYTAPFNVVLTGTAGTTIRYTTDGSTPTATTGTVYSAPIAVNTTTTIKAISVSGTNTSAVLTLTYTFPGLAVSEDKASGTYYEPFSVILTSTAGATIRYTTDGSTPTATTGTVYSAPIAVNATTTIKAVAISGTNVSSILSLNYTFAPLSISADKASGTYSGTFALTLTSSGGATIRYTTDGTNPTATTGTIYSSPIAVNNTSTIKAISILGSNTSSVLTLNYTIASSIKVKTTVAEDDVEETRVSGAINTTSTTLQFADVNQYVGIRFPNITLPTGATVTKAYLQFSTKTTNAANATVKIAAQKGNAAPFAVTNFNLTNRTFTSAQITWVTQPWTVLSEKTVKQQSPDITALIDEAISSNWTGTGALAFKIWSDAVGQATAAAHSTIVANNPELVIEYVIKPIERKPLGGILFLNEATGAGSVTNTDDWIELHNSSNDLISLDSVYVTDNKSKPTKFMFLEKRMNGKAFLTINADDNLAASTATTAAFGISTGGETLYLFQSYNGVMTLLDSLIVGVTEFNTSFGRKTDGAATVVKFVSPTPSVSNGTSKEFTNLIFSQERGLYPSAFNLTLTAAAGTTIRYTINGTIPSETSGTVYTAPINVNKSMVVKAIAFNASFSSGVVSQTYILESNRANETRLNGGITDTDYSKALKSLPIVSISTTPSGSDSPFDPNSYLLSHVEYIDNHINSGRTNFVATAGVRKFGQATAYETYGNLKVVFKADYLSKKAKYPFFDTIPGEKFLPSNVIQSLEFKAGQDRYSRIISERINQYTLKEMGSYALSTKYVNLFINGKFLGLRTMRDDFKANNMEEYFGDDDNNYTEINYQDGNWTNGQVEAGKGNPAQLTQIQGLVNNANYQGLKQKVEVDDYIRFIMMFCYNGAETESMSIGHNEAPKFTKYRFIFQDTDNGFTGGYGWGPIGPAQIYSTFGTGAKSNLEFKTRIKDFVLAYLQTPNAPMTANAMIAKITKLEQELDAVVKVDANVIGYSGWKNEMQRLRQVMSDKEKAEIKKWSDAGLAHTLRAVTFNRPAGKIAAADQVTIANPNAGTTVYYSLNGDDVVFDNGIATWAKAYTVGQALPLKEGKNVVKARAYTNGNFGPLTEVTYIVAPSINITGINYNAVAATGAEADKLEFVLVTNYGTEARAVGGDSITAAISFVFPTGTVLNPNETVMITKDLTKYPSLTLRKFLWTSGKLANEGERVVYKTAAGEIINEFTYLPTAPWPTAANGGGSYLKLKTTNLDNSKPENWEAATFTVAANLATQAATIKAYGLREGNKAVVSAYINNTAQVDYVTVEKYDETTLKFEVVETIGKTQLNNGYFTYTDNTPSVSTDNLYRFAMYRTGSKTPQYSDVVTLDFSHLIDYTVYPNPTTEYVDININQTKIENATIRVVSLYGQVVLQQQVSNATDTIHLELDKLNAGQYIIFMDIKGKRSIAKKLIITK